MHSPQSWLPFFFLLVSFLKSEDDAAQHRIGQLATSPRQSHTHDSFIRVQDGSFVKECKRHYLVSINYWSAMNLAADDSAGGNLTRFKTEVEQLAKIGVNNVRIMAASEGSNNGVQPFRMYPPLQPSVGVYDEKVFVGLDRALAEFSKHGISVIMTLNNFWHWSGGFSQYVSWADGNSQIPYPPSWDPALNPPWGDYTTNGSWGQYLPATGNYDGFTGYSGRFYNDSSITAQTQAWFRDHISKVINRVNSVTGLQYKDDPIIMTWELANEPQDPPLGWVVDTATYIKSLAPRQLVTVGFEGKNGEWWFKRVHAPQVIDYTCGHLWVQNWGFYDPLDPSDKNLTVAEAYADRYLENLNRWSLDIGKPLVLEEFGMARDNFENVARGAPKTYYLYDSSAKTTHRDLYFARIFSNVVEYFKQGKAFHGTGPWAYGGIWRPTDRRNSFDQTWAGDPPHEAPGWYDLYDTDPTLELISQQAKEVDEIISEIDRRNPLNCSDSGSSSPLKSGAKSNHWY